MIALKLSYSKTELRSLIERPQCPHSKVDIIIRVCVIDPKRKCPVL